MLEHATGTFEVKVIPQSTEDKAGGPAVNRMWLDKQFHGDLEGTSQGTMLASGNPTGSGGYVALEFVTATLKGRSGTFVLQHTGTMTRGVPLLTVTVVPDSGAGQLTGISGRFTVIMTAGKHSYEFEYSLEK